MVIFNKFAARVCYLTQLVLKELDVIGRAEIVDFPEIGLKNVAAKIDTGAYTSSIHCKEIIRIDEKTVECTFLDEEHDAYAGKKHQFEILDEKNVKSSNGEIEKRFMIVSTIQIFGKTHPILLTLTDRAVMRFPVLLGRKFIKNKYLVDVSLKNQLL